MPELPEVQTVVVGLNRKVRNLEIIEVWTDYKSDYYKGKKNIKDPAFFKKFKKEVLGQKIIKAERRAKNIFIYLSNQKIIFVHLKMTGHFLFGDFIYNKGEKKYIPKDKNSPLNDRLNQFVHFVLVFENNKVLALSDMRKFATVSIISAAEKDKVKNILGPEPFGLKISDLNLERFKNGKIKTVLMNPEFIAGIGNIYSDEILWQVGIHPETIVKNILKTKWKEILDFAEKILKSSIEIGGDSMSDFRNIDGEKGKFQNKHKCYKLENTKCKKVGCGGILEKKKVGGRVARFCPKHQKI